MLIGWLRRGKGALAWLVVASMVSRALAQELEPLSAETHMGSAEVVAEPAHPRTLLDAQPAPETEPPLITLIETGLASWYHPSFAGRRMANGQPYRPAEFTAAHKTLPLDSHARVKNISNDVEVVVRITDRGPHLPSRVIDVSQAAARLLGLVGLGITLVEVHSADEEEWDEFVARHPPTKPVVQDRVRRLSSPNTTPSRR